MKADPAPLPTILVLASGSGTNLQALIDASRDRDFPGDIVAVGCNKPGAFALERAAQANIKTFVINHKDYGSREEFDGALMAEIRRHNPDGDVIFIDGVVSRKWQEDGKNLVEISQRAETHRSELSATGAAIVELPSRG